MTRRSMSAAAILAAALLLAASYAPTSAQNPAWLSMMDPK